MLDGGCSGEPQAVGRARPATALTTNETGGIMLTSTTRSGNRRHVLAGALMVVALVAASCSSGSESGSDEPSSTPAAETTAAPDTTAAPESSTVEETVVDTAVPADTTTPPDGELAISAAFPTLAPPTGEEMLVGLVNTEGTPGLDFPEIREDIAGAFDYLNQHGGYGGRPLRLETCAAKGSPETSQACAQELAGKGVELVLVGLDLFPDYATYTAANIPVIGILPILPGDYTADALFLTGGNATLTSAPRRWRSSPPTTLAPTARPHRCRLRSTRRV
jgi:hypothetical protein